MVPYSRGDQSALRLSCPRPSSRAGVVGMPHPAAPLLLHPPTHVPVIPETLPARRGRSCGR
jgi:hypothetical protein